MQIWSVELFRAICTRFANCSMLPAKLTFDLFAAYLSITLIVAIVVWLASSHCFSCVEFVCENVCTQFDSSLFLFWQLGESAPKCSSSGESLQFALRTYWTRFVSMSFTWFRIRNSILSFWLVNESSNISSLFQSTIASPSGTFGSSRPDACAFSNGKSAAFDLDLWSRLCEGVCDFVGVFESPSRID